MQHECLLPHSQQTATCPYPERRLNMCIILGVRSVGCHHFVTGTDADRYRLLHSRSVTYNNEVQCKQGEGEGRILTEMTNGRINAEKQRKWAWYDPLSAVDVVTTNTTTSICQLGHWLWNTGFVSARRKIAQSFLTYRPQTQHCQKRFSDRAQHKEKQNATPND